MVDKISSNELDAVLASLRVHDADSLTTARVRARCLTLLAAQQRPDPELDTFPRAWQRWLEPAAATALCALYLAAAIRSVFSLYQ